MNKVIIIGDDHSNTLGVIRTFGENGIKPYLFVISNTKFVSVKKSKYLERFWVCESEYEALLRMIILFENEEEKPVLIPTSDKASAAIDSSYDKLSAHFICHNIDGRKNRIIECMDKYEQFKIAKNNDIDVALSQVLNYPFSLASLDKNMSFPFILKPLLSIDGIKDDITISNNNDELKRNLDFYNSKNYKTILCQEMLDFDYECDMAGFSYKGKVSFSAFIQKERIWPLKKGSFTYGKVRRYNDLEGKLEKIKKMLENLNYTGMLDVDFFVKDDKVYLNEINFRNSGLAYLYGNAKLCYYYYLSCIKDSFITSPKINKEYYVMDDQSEIHHVLERNISYKTYKYNIKNCEFFLTKNVADFKPVIYMTFYKILKNLKLYKFLYLFEKVYHSCPKCYLLCSTEKNLRKDEINHDFQIVEMDSNNFDTWIPFEKSMKKSFELHNIYGIVIKKNNEVIGRGIIKSAGSEDKFVKIKSKKTYLLCDLFVDPKYRGKNYQCDIINILVKRYIKEFDFKLYAVVYKYNFPSWKNFEKIGFQKKKEFCLKRFLKHSINKEKV